MLIGATPTETFWDLVLEKGPEAGTLPSLDFSRGGLLLAAGLFTHQNGHKTHRKNTQTCIPKRVPFRKTIRDNFCPLYTAKNSGTKTLSGHNFASTKMRPKSVRNGSFILWKSHPWVPQNASKVASKYTRQHLEKIKAKMRIGGPLWKHQNCTQLETKTDSSFFPFFFQKSHFEPTHLRHIACSCLTSFHNLHICLLHSTCHES